MIKEIHPQTLCPIKQIYATSNLCKKCEFYISHELVKDEHSRIYSILINCNKSDYLQPFKY